MNTSRLVFFASAVFSFSISAFASDDDAGARRADRDPQLVSRAIDLNRAHARRLQLRAQAFLELQIFLQKAGVSMLCKPTRAPRLVEAEPETVRMNFLTHRLPVSPLCTAGDLVAGAPAPALQIRLHAFSATFTTMCEVRF